MLVDKKLEVYRTLPYTSIALDSGSIPSASDVYATSPPRTHRGTEVVHHCRSDRRWQDAATEQL